MTKDPFTHAIIGMAMETHRELGSGLKEEFYHQDFCGRLNAAGIEHLSKPRRDLIYRGMVVDTFEPDVVFEHRLIPELKALRGEFAAEHFTQILSYAKFWGISNGMLFDFGKASLLFQRVIYSPRTAALCDAEPPNFVTDAGLAATLIGLAAECLLDHGLGYRETTWNGLMRAALQSAGIPFRADPVTSIGRLGTGSLRCIEINGCCALSITALGKEVSAADRAALQNCLHWLDLPWGIALHFGRETADLRFVRKPRMRLPTDSGMPQIS